MAKQSLKNEIDIKTHSLCFIMLHDKLIKAYGMKLYLLLS